MKCNKQVISKQVGWHSEGDVSDPKREWCSKRCAEGSQHTQTRNSIYPWLTLFHITVLHFKETGKKFLSVNTMHMT